MNLRPWLLFLVPGAGCLPSPPALPAQTSTGSASTDTSASPATDDATTEPSDSGPGSTATEGTGDATSTGSTGADSTDEGSSTGEPQDFCGLPRAEFVFDPPDVFTVGGAPAVLATGSFVGNDDDPDIAVANDDNEPRIDILRGQGILSGFQIADPITSIDGASSVAIGEINGSPPSELAVLGQQQWQIYGPDPESMNSVMQLSGGVIMGASGQSILLADILGDSNDELVLAAGFNGVTGTVDVIEDPIVSVNGLAQLIDAGRNAQIMTTGDFNGDTQLDLALPRTDPAAGIAGPDFVDIVFNESTPGSPAFSTATVESTGDPWGVASADLDGDGVDDLVLGHTGVGSVPLQLFFGDGDGGFSDPISLPYTSTQTVVRAADLDCDGDIDIVAGANGDVVVWRANGPGNFDSSDFEVFVAGTGLISDIAIADMDLSNRLDIVVALRDAGEVAYLEAN
ncbi:MAG: VCBS repeat-containing protein [Myxococcota bacterium]